MDELFGSILSHTLMELADLNRNDVETEEIDFNSDDNYEIAFE